MGHHITWQEKLERYRSNCVDNATERKQRTKYAQSVRGKLVRRGLSGLIKRVADVHCVDSLDMLGPTQRRAATRARHVLWAAIRALRPALTLQDIGGLFMANRSAVGQAIRRVQWAEGDAVLGGMKVEE